MTSVDQGLTDLHVNAYKQKHMVVICKTTELPKHDMPLITPTNHDQSSQPGPIQSNTIQHNVKCAKLMGSHVMDHQMLLSIS